MGPYHDREEAKVRVAELSVRAPEPQNRVDNTLREDAVFAFVKAAPT